MADEKRDDIFLCYPMNYKEDKPQAKKKINKKIIITIVSIISVIIVSIVSIIGYNYSYCDDKATSAIAVDVEKQVSQIRNGALSFVSFNELYFDKSLHNTEIRNKVVGSAKVCSVAGKTFSLSFTAVTYTDMFTGSTRVSYVSINDDYFR